MRNVYPWAVINGLLILMVGLVVAGGWAAELVPGSREETSRIFSHRDLPRVLDKTPASFSPIRALAAQIEQTVALAADIPVEGRCAASDGSVGFQGETRRGRLCPTQYSLEVPADADGFLIALDKRSATDLILVLSFASPIEESDQLFISRPEGEPIANREFLACVKPDCPVFQGGTWFIGLINFSSEAQTYTLAGSITPVRLESGVARLGTIEGVPEGFAGTLGFVDYTIQVPEDTQALTIELESQTGGNIDLAVRFGQPVTIQQGRLVADFLQSSSAGQETLTINTSSSPTLRAGTYFMLAINRERARQNFIIKATIGRQPAPQPSPLRADPSSLSFEATVGGANPTPQTLQLTNTAENSIAWGAAVNVPWLKLDVSQGALNAGASTTINISVEIAGLAIGSHEGRVIFSVAGFDPLVVPVTLTLKGQPPAGGELVALKFALLEFVEAGDWERSLREGCVVYTNRSNGPSVVRVTLPDGVVREFEVPAGQEVLVCGDVVHIDTRR